MERDVSIRDVTPREFVGVSEADSVRSTVELMHEEDVGSVLVMRGSSPVGIMTERDVLEMVATDRDPESTTVDEVMSNPVVSVDADRSLADAADVMSREEIRNLLVTEDADGTIVGVLTERDVIDAAGTLQASRSLPDDANPAGVASTSSSVDSEATASTDGYGTQGVCELCGALSESLYDANGQLVCSNCRQV
ncbi:CBS domain-containing protein [Haloarchaeobius sp. HRN-SO-5]|uniref:CBS domain-containing protein n=1 Tax=Haloarchaeobius sp. HRN-SO-5 TaxID=3446118 RepID=UPI003EB99F32